jgi:hypothetical protein
MAHMELLWARLAELPLVVESCEYDRLHAVLAHEFQRVTTHVRLVGAGAYGLGEAERERDRLGLCHELRNGRVLATGCLDDREVRERSRHPHRLTRLACQAHPLLERGACDAELAGHRRRRTHDNEQLRQHPKPTLAPQRVRRSRGQANHSKRIAHALGRHRIEEPGARRRGPVRV